MIAQGRKRARCVLLAATASAISCVPSSPAARSHVAQESFLTFVTVAAVHVPPGTPQTVIEIPDDWREHYPYSERFPQTKSAPEVHVIDLAAIRFVTDGLVSISENGRPAHAMPSLVTFAPELDAIPFLADRDDYYIVQAKDAGNQSALREWLEASEIPILDYLPQLAYLVRISAEERRAIETRSEVFWIGNYSPAFRIDPLLDFVIESNAMQQIQLRALFDADRYQDQQSLLSELHALGFGNAKIVRRSRDWSVRVEAAAGRARDLVLMAGCLWVERFVPPLVTNNTARSSLTIVTGRGASNGPIMDVEDVWARGIRGEGQIAAAADTGLSTGDLSTLHQDFGQSGSVINPLRVLAGYALGRPGNWNDDQAIGGGHGTHVAGSLVGNGFRSGSTPATNTYPSTCYAGAAPQAQLVFQSLMNASGGLGGIPPDLNVLFQQAYDAGARVHSNSWATNANGGYGTESQELDQFSWRNKDMVITAGAGNGGNDSASPGPIDGIINRDCIGGPGTAKNGITIGASENYSPNFVYEFPAGDCTSSDGIEQRTWGWFRPSSFGTAPIFGDLMSDNAGGMGAISARGPTNDGRIKPDLIAPGIAVVSTRTDVNQTFEQWGTCAIPPELHPYYVTRGGTSMATPLAAGAATLVRQYYVSGWHANDRAVTNGGPTPGDSFNPSSALVKATLINGAWDMNPGQYGTGPAREIVAAWDNEKTLPNNVEGFGRVDVETSLFPGSGWADAASRRLQVHDVATGLTTGQRRDFTFVAGGNEDPLIVTLVWTDPQGAIGAGAKLVNDLDLTVTDPSGTTTYFPNGVDKTSGKDAVNNVEQVKVTSPADGTWSIAVAGTNVPGNAEAGSTAQPFALVISGQGCEDAPSVPAAVTATAVAPNRITVSWAASTGSPNSYRIYRSRGPACPDASYFAFDTVSAAAVTYEDFTVSGGETYSYKVAAVGTSCESATSECSSAVASGMCTLPPSFAGLASAEPAGTSSCSMLLSWLPASSSCPGAVSYNIYRSTTATLGPAPANKIASGIGATTYSDVNVAPGETYVYVVRAVVNGIEDANSVKQSGSPVGLQTTVHAESFDALAPGNLAGFSISGTGVSDWRGVMACSPNQSPDHVFRFGGTDCTASYANGANTQAVLGGLVIAANAIETRLELWHRWDFESLFDGGTLLIKRLGDGGYTNVPVSAFLSGPYNDSAFGQAVWGGTFNSTMTHTIVDLDVACNAIAGNTGGCAGKTLSLAFLALTDGSAVRPGWFIDDVDVTHRVPCDACAPPGVPDGLTATASANNRIDLSWAAVAGAANYSIHRESGTCPMMEPALIASGVTGTTYTDTGLSGGMTYRYVVRAVAPNGCESENSTCQSATALGPALPAPPVFTATAISTDTVSLTWSLVDGASSYVIERRSASESFTPVGISAGSQLTDTGRSADTAYLYRVFAQTATGEQSAERRDVATTINFNDDPIVPGSTPIRATHVTQLRAGVDAVRMLAHLGAASFTDPTITPGTVLIRRDHLVELRKKLDRARGALGLAPLVYTDPAISAGITRVKAVHVEELRNGVQ